MIVIGLKEYTCIPWTWMIAGPVLVVIVGPAAPKESTFLFPIF